MTTLRGVGFFVVMAYALRRLSPQEIGVWYVLITIAGLGAIVEFGFAATIGRYASYYFGGADHVPPMGTGHVASGAVNRRAIASLVRMAHGLYQVFAVLVGAAMLAAWAVWWVLGDELGQYAGAREHAALLLAVVGTAVNMTGMYWPSILYGIHRVRQYNQWMVAGLVANYVVALAGLLADAGILALVLGQLVGSAVPRLAARRIVRAFLQELEDGPEIRTTWRDLWPTTWRAGVLALCTYLTIGTTTAFCYVFADLRTAASYGLTMQMALMLHSTSALWVWVKMPTIGALRVRGDWRSILALLQWRLPVSLLTYSAGATVVIVVAPWALDTIGSQTDMLARPVMIALLVLIGFDLVVGHHSALLQTGNEIPHLPAFCLAAALTLLLIWPLGSRFDVWGVIGAPLLAQSVVSYWWVPYQFWHRLRAGLRRQRTAQLAGTP